MNEHLCIVPSREALKVLREMIHHGFWITIVMNDENVRHWLNEALKEVRVT